MYQTLLWPRCDLNGRAAVDTLPWDGATRNRGWDEWVSDCFVFSVVPSLAFEYHFWNNNFVRPSSCTPSSSSSGNPCNAPKCLSLTYGSLWWTWYWAEVMTDVRIGQLYRYYRCGSAVYQLHGHLPHPPLLAESTSATSAEGHRRKCLIRRFVTRFPIKREYMMPHHPYKWMMGLKIPRRKFKLVNW